MRPQIMITLDVEECDIPTEYGYDLPLEEQLSVSRKGVESFMNLMDRYEIPVTIFCTGVYAEANADWIKALHPRHALASHGYYHGHFDPKTDLKSSKDLLEKLSGKPIYGFRMARMQYVPEEEIVKSGYTYHSSLNPTWIPGRYDHRDKPMKAFFEKGLWQVPASVTPRFRIPLFWLAFKNFPLLLYKYLTRASLQNGFLNLYFHPWEFTNLDAYPLPGHVKRGHEGRLLEKMERYLRWLKSEDLGDFITMDTYVGQISKS